MNSRKKYRENHPDKINAYKAKWREKNSYKSRAHRAVLKAIKDGILVRPDHCQVCKVKAEIHSHHRDYAEPLKVMWVCRKCHAAEHANPRAKISPEMATEIRNKYVRFSPRSSNTAQLAKEYGLNKSSIQRIIAGTQWKNLASHREDNE